MTPRMIEQLQAGARRRLPRALYDTIEGGAGDEAALRRNRAALDQMTIAPRVLTGLAKPLLRTTILNKPAEAPIIVAPTGMNGFYWPRGELAVARAAMEAGLIHAVSAFASVAVEDIAALGPARRWFQLYPLADRGVLDDLMARAKATGFEALCVTVDAPVVGLRKRDVRNGVQFPPKLSASLILSALSKPAWAAPFMMGYRPEFANLKGYRIDQRPDARGVSTPELDAAFAWADLARIARVWDGPVIVKGVMHVDDARAARDSGATAIVVSNHGGRQCDAAPATLEALSTIAAAALEGLELLVDGGVSSGLDVLKYRHAGARACLVGRAVLYGLASTGQRGAAAALSILKTDLRNAAILAGVSL